MEGKESFGDLVRPALLLFITLTLLTGAAYPLLITCGAQLLFPWQANGSLVTAAGVPVKPGQPAAGSRLIGQPFSAAQYFWGRPSATAPFPYNAAASGGSNLGPLHPALAQAVKARIAALAAGSPPNATPVPADLVTASASGLDPQLSPDAALYQAPRVAAARGLPLAEVQGLVQRYTEDRTMGILGEPRVNVLLLNLVLDRATPLAGNSR
jgi:potassium-transporting ATPase KdpC subunit